jgi:hypothetical protein
VNCLLLLSASLLLLQGGNYGAAHHNGNEAVNHQVTDEEKGDNRNRIGVHQLQHQH